MNIALHATESLSLLCQQMLRLNSARQALSQKPRRQQEELSPKLSRRCLDMPSFGARRPKMHQARHLSQAKHLTVFSDGDSLGFSGDVGRGRAWEQSLHLQKHGTWPTRPRSGSAVGSAARPQALTQSLYS